MEIILTVEQRLQVYELALEKFSAYNSTGSFLCARLREAMNCLKLTEDYINNDKIPEIFPEFKNRKPFILPYKYVSAWFTYSDEGYNQRIDLLKACIEDVKTQLIPA